MGDWRTLFIENMRPRKLMPASVREDTIVGDWDAADRRRDQASDGVVAEVIFPTFGLQGCWSSEDAQFQHALCHAYNDWASSVFDDPRLVPAGLVAMLDVDGAIEDARAAPQTRASTRSACPSSVPQRPYNDAAYDRFWAAAQELGLPLTFHSGTGHEPHVAADRWRGDRLPHGRATRRPHGVAHPRGGRRTSTGSPVCAWSPSRPEQRGWRGS